MNDNKIFRASIHFYSNNTDELVSVMTEFSDELDVGDEIPAAYSQAQTLAMILRSSAVSVELNDAQIAILEDETLTEDERTAKILSSVDPADVIAAEVTE